MNKDLLPALYAAVAEGSMFGIVVFEPSGSCLYLNSMATQLLGTTEPQLLEMMPKEEKPNFKNFSIDFLKHDGFYQDILVSSLESTFIANIGVRSLEVDGQPVFLLMLQDVTLQKKLQREIMAKQKEIKAAFEELLSQNRQLRDLDLAKDRFIALTTHELRTPLSAMVASAEILKLGLYDTPDQMRQFVDMIYEQGLHLQDLVNDILDFAKVQAGKMDYYLEQQDPLPLAQAVMRHYESMAEANQVKLIVQPPSHQLLCYFDEVRLRQVLSNMINNAIKYNRPQGTVTLLFGDSEDLIRIYVRDTGRGIAKENYGKVFDEFETVGQVDEHHRGTGLGLPISRKLAQGMGGHLLVDSEVGVGSTFWVEIPKHKVMSDHLYGPRPGKKGDLAA